MPEIPETNPYQAPKNEPQVDSERARAEKALRVLLLILLVPSYLNFGIFVSFVSANRTFTIINFCLILILAILIWHLGFSFMIKISGIIHKHFASSKDLDRWQSVLFRSMLPLPRLGIAGAILWGLWLVGFYPLRMDFYLISQPVLIAAHLLLACFYLPLFYRWWQLPKHENNHEIR